MNGGTQSQGGVSATGRLHAGSIRSGLHRPIENNLRGTPRRGDNAAAEQGAVPNDRRIDPAGVLVSRPSPRPRGRPLGRARSPSNPSDGRRRFPRPPLPELVGCPLLGSCDRGCRLLALGPITASSGCVLRPA